MTRPTGSSGLLLVVALGLLLFWGLSPFRGYGAPAVESESAVVIPAPLQLILYGGDRFLAADIESFRSVMSGGTGRSDEALFRARAHREASLLNPCHEDNYWIGNGELTWGGAQDIAMQVIRAAMACRFWDEWPPFFYGFNQYFFHRNLGEAKSAILEAATRTKDEKNSASFRTIAIMLEAGSVADLSMAIKMLEAERDRAKEPRLRERLAKRVIRLRGLALLRDAQAAYEKDTGKLLDSASRLIDSGYLQALPEDPVGLGYAFVNGRFELAARQDPGLESLRARK